MEHKIQQLFGIKTWKKIKAVYIMFQCIENRTVFTVETGESIL